MTHKDVIEGLHTHAGDSTSCRNNKAARREFTSKRAVFVYRSISGALLGLTIFFLLLPWITGPRVHLVPKAMTSCRYRQLTGDPCLFCGLTRGMNATYGGRWQEAISFHPLALAIVAIAALEVLFRGVVVLGIFQPWFRWSGVAVDVSVHVLLLAMIIAYTAWVR
ncbi:MAG TPA: DUF2752 domain-containing protein [Phycisphaerae bacterium]|nr:DUF2752 domain-containing protein [Phycisphaerae bacterium]